MAIVSRDGNTAVSESEIAELTRTYQTVRGPGECQSADANGTARVSVIGAPGQIQHAGDSWVAVSGRPYTSGSLSDARLEDLDGHFALVSHDAEQGAVRVAADPFAMQTLFVAERGEKLYFSTSALTLATFLRARPDRFGIEVFLRAGYHFGRLTNWEGIERLDPAGYVLFVAGRTEHGTYWRPEIDRDVTRLGLAEALERCSATAMETYRAHLSKREPAWVDLTGGYDTRLLALLLEKSGVDFVCDTRGDVDDEDRRIARRMSRLKNWHLFDPTMPSNWSELLPGLLSTALAWGDANLQVLELAWVLWVHGRMAEKHDDLLSGGGGEHWRGFAWPQEFLRAGRSSSVNMDNWIDMRLLHPFESAILAKDRTPEIREDFRTRMTEWAAPYSGELNTVQLDMMYAYKMTGHFGAYRSSDSAFLAAELPFYFKPVFTTAVSVDHRHRGNHRLMRHLISSLDPALGALPTGTGGPAAPWRPWNFHRFLPYYARIGRRAVTKLSQTTIGRPLLAPKPGSWWAPPAARAAALDSLGNGKLDVGALASLSLYEPRALETYLERARGTDFGDADVLGRIITIELALRQVGATLESG